jgi:hypothetical protein
MDKILHYLSNIVNYDSNTEIFVLIYPFVPKGTMGCKYGLITHNYIHEC